MTRLVLSNARIVLADEVIDGSLAIEDGMIAAIDSGPSTRFDDVEGDYLIPGLVELAYRSSGKPFSSAPRGGVARRLGRHCP